MRKLFLIGMILMIFATLIWAQQPTTPPATATPALMESGSFDHAMQLYRQRRYQDAISEFEKIVAADPTNAAAYYFMGYAYYVTGHRQEALAAFTKAFEADPAFDPRPYFRR